MSVSPNSALYWFPLVEHVYRTPRTVFVPYDHDKAMATLEGGEPLYDAWMTDVSPAVVDAVDGFGGVAFARTDLSSAKHDGPGSYRLVVRDVDPDRFEVNEPLLFTVGDNEMKFWLTGPTPQAFMVREWLDLAAPFTAFGEHPIAREWRFFANRDQVVCQHFYWPEHAILTPSTDSWREDLAALAAEPPPDELTQAAIAAAAACDTVDVWSVDFAQDRSGDWWLIDMATADTSWHPEHEAGS